MVSNFMFGIIFMFLVDKILNSDSLDTRAYTIIILMAILIVDISVKYFLGGL